MSKLNQKQGVVNDRLKSLKERKNYYAFQQIDEVLRRCGQEQILKDKLEGDRARLADLTVRFNDVTAKYKALCQGVKGQLENYRQSQKSRILKLSQEKQLTEEQMLAEYVKRRENVESDFSEKIDVATNAI